MQTALLNSISHDLRTPLVSIIGTLSGLQKDGMHLNSTAKKDLIKVARDEADRLNHLIANLLDVSRIEAGAVPISKRPSDVQDIIGAAIEQIRDRVDNRNLNINIPESLPLIPVDFGLIVQVLVNILDNAVKFSPSDLPIDITVNQHDTFIQIEVADRGSGIPPQDLSRIFDKFYRGQTAANIAGTGLGLAICKGFVEAHSGYIIAESRHGGGTVITVSLPVK